MWRVVVLIELNVIKKSHLSENIRLRNQCKNFSYDFLAYRWYNFILFKVLNIRNVNMIFFYIVNTFFKVSNVTIFLIEKLFSYEKSVNIFNVFFFLSFFAFFSLFFFFSLSELISIERAAKTLSLIMLFDDFFKITSFEVETDFRSSTSSFIFILFLCLLATIVCEETIFSKNFLTRWDNLIIWRSRRRRQRL